MKTVFRTDGQDRSYTRISNKLLQNRALSWETRGMLCDILSRNQDWDITPAGLLAMKGGCGRDRIYKLLKEAMDNGFIRMDERRDVKGRHAERTYIISDDPDILRQIPHSYSPLPENPDTVNQEAASPLPGKPDTDSPDTVKPTQQRKDLNKEKKETNSNPLTPLQGEVIAEQLFPEEQKVLEPQPVTIRRKRKGKGETPAYTASFLEAWKVFPEHAGMSRPNAFQSWQNEGCENIADEVIAGIKGYASLRTTERRKRPDSRVKHMQGWLTERRWESFDTEPVAQVAQDVTVSIPAEPELVEEADGIRRAGGTIEFLDQRYRLEAREKYSVFDAAIRTANRLSKFSSLTMEQIKIVLREIAIAVQTIANPPTVVDYAFRSIQPA